MYRLSGSVTEVLVDEYFGSFGFCSTRFLIPFPVPMLTVTFHVSTNQMLGFLQISGITQVSQSGCLKREHFLPLSDSRLKLIPLMISGCRN